MSTDANKATAREFFARFSESDLPGALALLSGLVAEGDRVAVEVVSEGDLKNGRQYRQQYHMLLEFRGSQICAVREYLDTQHAHAVWIAAQ